MLKLGSESGRKGVAGKGGAGNALRPPGRTGRRSGFGLQWCANGGHSEIRTGAIAQVFPTLARQICKGLRFFSQWPFHCFRDRAARPEGRTTPPTDPDARNERIRFLGMVVSSQCALSEQGGVPLLRAYLVVGAIAARRVATAWMAAGSPGRVARTLSKFTRASAVRPRSARTMPCS